METRYWLIIGGMTLVTFFPRVLPFFLINGEKLPPAVKEWLRLLPIVIFASMIAPPLLIENDTINPAAHAGEIFIVAVSAVIAYFTKKIPLCLGTAVVVLLLINFLNLN